MQAEILKNFNVNLKEKMKRRSLKDKIKLVLGHPICIIFNIFITLLVIHYSLTKKFTMEACLENTFENVDQICQPCLPELKDPFCLTCASETQCTSCQYGNVLKSELLPLGISYLQVQYIEQKIAATCESCGVIHGDLCLDCSREECKECSGSYFIDEGVCKPCTEKPGCLSCDDLGCLECEDGYYLFK